jgi:hypothetical protein
MNLKKFISAVLAATTAFSIFNVTASADFETEDGKTYYIVDGEKEKGFEKIDGNYYYFKQADGAMAKGWLKISGNWYYFSTKDGKMFAGKSYKIGGETYTFAADGKLTAYKSEGFLKGAWGDSNAELAEKIGETYVSEAEMGDDSGIGYDSDVQWVKTSNKTAVSELGLYYFANDKYAMGMEIYITTAPIKDIAKYDDIYNVLDGDYLTKNQVTTIYKMKLNEAERKCREPLPSEVLAGLGEGLISSPDEFADFKSFLSEDFVILILHTEVGVIYCEISIDTMAEAYGMSKSEILEKLTEN